MNSRHYDLHNNSMILHSRYLSLMENETDQNILDIMEAMHYMINIFHFSYNRSILLNIYENILETTYEIIRLSYSNLDECCALLYRLYSELKS